MCTHALCSMQWSDVRGGMPHIVVLYISGKQPWRPIWTYLYPPSIKPVNKNTAIMRISANWCAHYSTYGYTLYCILGWVSLFIVEHWRKKPSSLTVPIGERNQAHLQNLLAKETKLTYRTYLCLETNQLSRILANIVSGNRMMWVFFEQPCTNAVKDEEPILAIKFMCLSTSRNYFIVSLRNCPFFKLLNP